MKIETQLSNAIEKRGLAKTKIAKRLGISRPTLYSRLKDGNFTKEQINTIVYYYL